MDIIITPDTRTSEEEQEQDSTITNASEFDPTLSQVPPIPSPAVVEVLSPPEPAVEVPPSVTPDEIHGGKAAVPFIIIPTRFKQQDSGPRSATSARSISPSSGNTASVLSKPTTASNSPTPSVANLAQGSSSPVSAANSSLSAAVAAAPAGSHTAADWLRGFNADHPAEHAIFAGKIDDKKNNDDEATKKLNAAREAEEAKAKQQASEAAAAAAAAAVTTAAVVVPDHAPESDSLPSSPQTIARSNSQTFDSLSPRQSLKPMGSFALVGANRGSMKFAVGALSSMLSQAGVTINQTAAPASDPVADAAAEEAFRQQAATKALNKDIQKALGGTTVTADGTLHLTSSTGTLTGSGSKTRLAKGNVIAKRGSLGHISSPSFQSSYAHVTDMGLMGAAVDAIDEPSQETVSRTSSVPRSHTRHSSQASITEEDLGVTTLADRIRLAINDAANADVSVAEEKKTDDLQLEVDSALPDSSATILQSKPSAMRQQSSLGQSRVFNAAANAAAVAAAAAAAPKQTPATALDLIPPQRPNAGLSWPLSRDRINRTKGAWKDMGKAATSKPLLAAGLTLSQVEASLQQVVHTVPLTAPSMRGAQADAQTSREVHAKEDPAFASRVRLVGGPHIVRTRGLRPARLLTTLKDEQKDEAASPVSPSAATAPAFASSSATVSASSFLFIGHEPSSAKVAGEKSGRIVGKQPSSSKLRKPVHPHVHNEEKQNVLNVASSALTDMSHSERTGTDQTDSLQLSGSDSDDGRTPGARTSRARVREVLGYTPSTAASRARPASLSPIRNSKGQSASTRVPFGALRSQLLYSELVVDESPVVAAARRRHEAREKTRLARLAKETERTTGEKPAADVEMSSADYAAVSSIPEDSGFSSDEPSSPVGSGAPMIKKRIPRSKRREYSIHSRMQVSLTGSLVDTRAEELEKLTAQKSWVDATAERTEELAALAPQHQHVPISAPELHLSTYAPAQHLSLAGSYLTPAILAQALKNRPQPTFGVVPIEDAVSDTIGHLHEKKLLEAAGKLPAIFAATATAAITSSSNDGERASTPLSRLITKGEVASAASLTSQQPHQQPPQQAGSQTARLHSEKIKQRTQQPHWQQPHSARGDSDRPSLSSYVPSPPLRPSIAFAPAPPAGMAPLLPSPPATPAVHSHLTFAQQAAALLGPSSSGSSYARPSALLLRRPPPVVIAATTSAAAEPFVSTRAMFHSSARAISPVDLTPRYTFQLPKKAAPIR